MLRRVGASEDRILAAQTNLSTTYACIGRLEQALQMDREVYCGRVKLNGNQHEETLIAANNYADDLVNLQRFEEARTLLRKTMPVARRVLGECHRLTLKIRRVYAKAIYKNPAAPLDDLREALTTLEDTERTARRVLGGAHPTTKGMEGALREARAALRARETPSTR